MKRIILMALTLVAMEGISLTYAQAQSTELPSTATVKEPKSPEDKAQALTARMTKNLMLTNEQIPKIQTINLDKVQKLSQLKDKYAGNRRQGFSEYKAVNQEWDKELKAVLSAEQYAKYETSKHEMKEARREKMKNRRSDGQ